MKATTFPRRGEINLRDFKKFETLNTTIIPRSFVVAIILGSLLNLFNQFDMIFGTEAMQILPLMLTYITPFFVVMFSQRFAIARAWQDFYEGQVPSTTNSPRSVAIFHGIPSKALLLGVIVGSVNTAILLLSAYLDAGEFNMVPLIQIGQFYLIPILFGLLSQALSYRRAITDFMTQ